MSGPARVPSTRLSDREAARVAAAVTAVIQLAGLLGWTAISSLDAAQATAVAVTTLPVVLLAGEWVRRRVWSHRSVATLHPHHPSVR